MPLAETAQHEAAQQSHSGGGIAQIGRAQESGRTGEQERSIYFEGVVWSILSGLPKTPSLMSTILILQPSPSEGGVKTANWPALQLVAEKVPLIYKNRAREGTWEEARSLISWRGVLSDYDPNNRCGLPLVDLWHIRDSVETKPGYGALQI